MALILSDRVRETTTTTGTGAFSLGGAATGYRAFSSVMANADTTYYTCAGQGTSEWEVGIGTWNTGNTLTRTTILASSNGGSAVTFSAGTKDIFITYTATKVVIQDASGNVGIGTSSPGTKLDVTTATAGFYAARIFNTSITGYGLKIKNGIDSNDALRISNAADSADNILMYGSGNAYFAGSVSAGAGIGSRGTSISVSGSTDSSPIAAKSGSYATVFGVLPHSNSWTYLSTGVYYQNGVWTHASANTDSALLGLSGSNGGAWWASSNSSASWNVASAVGLWNASGRWVSDVTAPTDVRAPIFYDSNDTNFYGDFASNSKLYTLEVNGANANASSDSTLFVSATSSNDWGIHLSKASWEYGIRYNLAATHTYGIYGQKNGTEYFRVGTDQGYHSASFRAPIFYDSDNTAYYGDFASNSVFNNLGLGGVTPDLRLSVNGDSHISSILYMGGTAGSYNSWGSRTYTTSGVWYNNSSSVEFNNYGYGSTWTFTLGSGNAISSGSMRAPIFYDSNNTAYYGDFAGVSYFSKLIAGSTSGINTGYNGVFGTNQVGAFSGNKIIYFFNDGSNIKVDAYDYGVSGALNIQIGGNGGYTTIDASTRSPIFYDSNDTNYYGDFHSVSNVNALTATRIGVNPSASSSNGYGISLYGGYSSGEPTYGLMFQGTGTFGTYGGVNADWATYFTMNSTAGRGWIYRNISTGNVASITNDGRMSIDSHFEQGNNFAHPNIEWSASSTSSGMVIFYLPGTTGNYGMVHMVFDIYEYDSPRITTVVVGGHNWSTSWYNVACNVVGFTDKSVRLGVKDGRFVVVFGTSGSSWSYGTIRLRKIHNGSFYNNQMDMVGNWSVTQTTTESFTNVSGDLRALRTPSTMTVDGILYGLSSVRSPIFYDYNDTNYYLDPASTTSLRTVGDWRADSAAWTGDFAGKIQYHSSNWYFQYASQYIFRNSGGTNVAYGDTSGNSWSIASYRAPIFYDSDNTAYYGDFASSSVFSTVYIVGTIRNDSSVAIDDSFGLYFDSGGSSSYAIYRGPGAWTSPYPDLRIGFHTGIQIGAYSSYGGIRFYDNDDMVTQVMSVNNSADGAGGGNVYVNNSLVAGSSLRAPLFYDSNNTAYYGDFASTSNFNVLQLSNGKWYNVSNGSGNSIEIYARPDNNTTYVWRHIYGGTGTGFGVGVGGYGIYADHGPGNYSIIFNSSGYVLAPYSFRSPIFYDSDNTGYYVDPASSSYLYSLLLSGASYFRPQNWIQFDGVYGLYWPSYYGLHVRANDLSTYTQLAIQGNKNSYGGIYDYYSAVNGIMYDSGGNGGVYREANGRWYFYHNVANDCIGIGTSSTNSTYGIYCNKGAYLGGRTDVTILYDANNSAFYVDPASTSVVNNVQITTLGVGTAASGTTGEIRATNNVTAYYSDERLKTRLGLIDNALDKLLSLEGFYYEANEVAQALGYTPVREVGVSAQAVQKILPEIVVPAPIDDKYLTVRYEKLVPLLIEAIKELSAKVDELQKRN